MEHEDESLRLELKTDTVVVARQAKWAGLKPGMRLADIGCGPGITTSVLNDIVQPNGETIGIDFSNKRIDYAHKHYNKNGLQFI